MNLPKYPLQASPDLSVFKFESPSQQGKLSKLINLHLLMQRKLLIFRSEITMNSVENLTTAPHPATEPRL